MSEFIQSLTPSLFWDVNREDVDEEKHRRFVMQRVLERGSLDDWRRMKDRYTISEIVAEARQMRSLEPKALAFIACVGGVREETFRCFTLRRLHQKHWFC